VSEAPVIELREVDFAYDGPPVLEHVTLRVGRNDFVSVVGPNGGGKSTLLRLMLGLLSPQRGEVRLLGQRPRQARRRVGYMPQTAQFDPQFPVTVMDVVLMGRLDRAAPLGPFRQADRKLALEALREVELGDLHRRPFAALSGGQRQRVLIARALACRPEVMLLDEPTANLDMQVEEQLYGLLRQLSRRMTILLVSHDVGFVSQFVERVICVNRRVEIHPTGEITGEVIRRLYGHDVRMVHHAHAHRHHEPERL
jgi:zinc transport system ATP-binding protein